ncbi:MAG: thiamine diphosphokinase [Anaerolineales bacterium]
MRVLVFANGSFQSESLDTSDFDLVIAADGGSDHCQMLGIRPQILIGDLDSTSQSRRVEWEKKGVEIIRHPQRKDKTDLEIALEYAQEKGADEIHVYGALGDRLDMTLGNILLLAHPDLNCEIKMICENEVLSVVRGGSTLILEGRQGDMVSLLPLLPTTSGITTQNLEYPLQEGMLAYGTTRGISNVMEGDQAVISLREGLLCVIHTQNKSS